VLAFVEASFRSVVHELDGPDLIAHALEEKQTWFVDFYAPWCHHCRDVWPEWNLAAHSDDLPHSVHFGKINCETHHDLCAEHHVHGYPTFLLFHAGVRHQFDFDARTSGEFVRFVKETLEPIEEEFTPDSYKQLIADPTTRTENDDPDQMSERWVIDFFAPWCSHCHVMSPKFREAAKALRGVVKFGKLNCELDASFCMQLGIRAYPTIWRFEPNQPRLRPTAQYPGLPDPKLILDFAMAEVPDFVTELTGDSFKEEVLHTPRKLANTTRCTRLDTRHSRSVAWREQSQLSFPRCVVRRRILLGLSSFGQVRLQIALIASRCVCE
jgi:DnaJ family protein C protein 10